MRGYFVYLVLFGGLLLNGCLVDENMNSGGTAADSAATAKDDSLSNLVEGEFGEEVESDAKIRRIINRRAARGDTATVSVARLKSFVPDAYGDYDFSDLNGEQVNLPDEGLRMTILAFDLNNGNRTIKVKITDLNGYPKNLITNWKIHQRKVKFRSESERTQSYEVGDAIYGYETVRIREDKAVLSMLVGNRFLVALEGDKMNSSAPLKKFFKKMKLQEMARLGDPGRSGGEQQADAPQTEAEDDPEEANEEEGEDFERRVRR